MGDIIGEKNKFHIPLAFFACGVLLRCLLGCYLKTPSIYWDELKYYGIARSLYQGMGISIRNMGTNFQKILYSIVLMPTFAIQNPKIRVYVITVINSVLMNSCVFPLWKFCHKLGLNEKQSIVMQAFLVIWPDLLLTETFMSENLYWPLFFWYILLRFTETKEKPLLLGICEGVLIYLGYLCKEVFAAILPVIAICLLLEPKLCGRDRRKCKKEWLRLLYTAITFGLLYLLAKLTIFSGMGRGYHQSSLDALFSNPGFLYFGYAVIYLFVAALLSLQAFPIMLPLLRFARMKQEHRRVFIFLLSFVVFTVISVAYAISIREDTGIGTPRIHLRYFAPALFLFLPFFFLCPAPEEESKEKTERQAVLLIAFIVIGVFQTANNSAFDQSTLQWASGWNGYLKDAISVSWLRFLLCIFEVALLVLSGYSIYRIYAKEEPRFLKAFLLFLLVPVLASNIIGHKEIKKVFAVDTNAWESGCRMEKNFSNLEGNILYLAKNNDGFFGKKTLDCCFDSVDRLYYMACSAPGLIESEDEEVIDYRKHYKDPVSAFRLSGYIDDGYYATADHIDYVLLPDDSQLDLSESEYYKFLPEISDDYYSVYQNLDPKHLNLDTVIMLPDIEEKDAKE